MMLSPTMLNLRQRHIKEDENVIFVIPIKKRDNLSLGDQINSPSTG